MSVSDSRYASFVDRVMNCREAEDRAKADTKELYAEIAEAGEDKTAIGQLVRELRVSEKDRIKANLRDAAVEDGRARYRRGKASHVRVREDEPEHDADGVIIEPGAMRPQAGATADSDLATGHTPTWPLTPADAGQIAPIHKPEAALLPQTGAAEALVDQSRNVEAAAPSAADVVPTSSAGTEGEQTGNHITDLTKPNPICRDPGDCGVYASWRMPCLSCTRAAQARAA